MVKKERKHDLNQQLDRTDDRPVAETPPRLAKRAGRKGVAKFRGFPAAGRESCDLDCTGREPSLASRPATGAMASDTRSFRGLVERHKIPLSFGYHHAGRAAELERPEADRWRIGVFEWIWMTSAAVASEPRVGGERHGAGKDLWHTGTRPGSAPGRPRERVRKRPEPVQAVDLDGRQPGHLAGHEHSVGGPDLPRPVATRRSTLKPTMPHMAGPK